MKKLFDMNGEELSKVLCRIVEPIGRMLEDPDVPAFFSKVRQIAKENNTMASFYLRLATEMAPVFLGEKHREETFEIIAGIKGVSADEVRNQPGISLMWEIVSMFLGDGGIFSIFRTPKTVQARKNSGDDLPAREPAESEIADLPD